MKISYDELIAVLAQFNPWWRGEKISDLPKWHRAAFHELFTWIEKPPAPRAILLSGARQVGKTTLLLQSIAKLLSSGVPAANILYVTFDHPLINLAGGIDVVIDAWREREPKANGIEYLFLDEAQFVSNCDTWIKHQVDFKKERRIIFTGSATPLIEKAQESGVGRWHTIKLTTLSFYEYLKLKKLIISQTSSSTSLTTPLPAIPKLKSLYHLFEQPLEYFYRITDIAAPYIGHFHEYLMRGGFPQTAQIESISLAQRLLREDIIDKVLKRDMTAIFGVRRILELERIFLYLCMHDGGLLDISELCSNLGVTRSTAQNYIEFLEATHLIFRLPPFGYGKEVLRGKYKIYLADPAISAAVLLKGKNILDDATALGVTVEAAVFKHLFTRYYPESPRFTYWRGTKEREVDIVAEIGNEIIPFEVKYRTRHTGAGELKGLLELCQKKSLKRAYVVTKSLNDFGSFEKLTNTSTSIMRIPALLLCYWMGEAESEFSYQ